MKRQMVSFITITLVVVVVIFVLPSMLRKLSLTPITLSSQPNDAATAEQVSVSDTNMGRSITLLAVTENQNGFGLQARPVSPTTLANLASYAPINFGHNYTYAVSPDRKMLAVITRPSGSDNAGGTLHLIDLETWTDTPADLRIDNYVDALTFSADGKALFWTTPIMYDPSHGMPRDYQLYRYDLDSRQLFAIAQLPSSFIPWSQRLSSGNVAIFGTPTDHDNLAEDVPHLLIIDPTENRIVADVRLDGVKAGQFREQAMSATSSAQEGSWEYVSYSPGLAWDLDHSVLYVVHADDNKVTLVDLVNGTLIKQTQSRPPHSLLDWISNSLATAAEAKGGPWLEARVSLSRDGKRLYVFSQKNEMGLLEASNMRVIATDAMREIGHLDELLTDFTLTPDDKSLLVVKGEIDKSYGFDVLVNRDVYVLDAATLRERIHVRIDGADELWFEGFSPDGHYAYLRGSSARWVEGSGWRDWRTTWQLLDLNSYRLISAGESESMYGALMHVAP